jgi:hypothetical protein
MRDAAPDFKGQFCCAKFPIEALMAAQMEGFTGKRNTTYVTVAANTEEGWLEHFPNRPANFPPASQFPTSQPVPTAQCVRLFSKHALCLSI